MPPQTRRNTPGPEDCRWAPIRLRCPVEENQLARNQASTWEGRAASTLRWRVLGRSGRVLASLSQFFENLSRYRSVRRASTYRIRAGFRERYPVNTPLPPTEPF
jgi:hypothetical protein